MINEIPWVEKYRPKSFQNIVLDSNNKQIFDNILKLDKFPNFLFYGPPGTGKTTTIINLIKLYTQKKNIKNRNITIHLNASDDRGIDTIRNNIFNFINSDGLFYNGIKFVILDEVDYMTKTAQFAVKNILEYNKKVRFCLICNYINKVDVSFQNEFIKIRFSELPKENIINYLKNIFICENINITDDIFESLYEIFKSDLRSSINYIQSNRDKINNGEIINKKIYSDLTEKIKSKDLNTNLIYIYELCENYNIDKKTLIKYYINYLINIVYIKLDNEFLNLISNTLHNNNYSNDDILKYFILNIKDKI